MNLSIYTFYIHHPYLSKQHIQRVFECYFGIGVIQGIDRRKRDTFVHIWFDPTNPNLMKFVCDLFDSDGKIFNFMHGNYYIKCSQLTSMQTHDPFTQKHLCDEIEFNAKDDEKDTPLWY